MDEQKEVTARELEALKESVGWKALTEVLTQRLSIVRNELEFGTELDLNELQKRQVECSDIRYFLRLPEILQEELKSTKDKEESHAEPTERQRTDSSNATV